MSDENTRDGRRRRAELRAAALRLGELLGWSSREAITFAEAVTNRPWRCCGCADLETVLEEYWAIGRVIQEKRARQGQEEDRHVAAR
jgi:Fe-S oxidoreductase